MDSRLSELTCLFNALRPTLSVVAVREVLEAALGWRVCRLMLDEATVVRVVPELRQRGLATGIVECHFTSQSDLGKGRHGRRLMRLDRTEPSAGYFFVYVGSDQAEMIRAAEAEADRDHEALGKALGVPECCRTAFRERYLWECWEQDDPTSLTSGGTVTRPPHSPWNNVAAKYFGYCLASFAPCSLSCTAAAERAEASFHLLRSVSPELAARFLEEQSSNIIYSEWEGVHRLVQSRWEGERLVFEGIESTAESELADALLQSDALEPQGSTHFRLWSGSNLIRTVGPFEGFGLFLCGSDEVPS